MSDGTVVRLNYLGANYIYLKNVLGDIMGIVDSTGVQVVSYDYNAWGEILSVTGSMAETLGAENPFRYRGYYYDAQARLLLPPVPLLQPRMVPVY